MPAADLQSVSVPELSVIGSRAFVGEPASLSSAATAVAQQMSNKSPIITLTAPNLGVLGVDPTGYCPPLPSPVDRLAALVPLRPPIDASEIPTKLALRPNELMPPPRNPWVPLSLAPPSQQMLRLGYRFAGGGFEGGGSTDRGVATLQVPPASRTDH